MTARKVTVVVGALLGLLAGPASAQSSKDWVDVKDPKELRALYSDKTLRGTMGGAPFVGHYSADGRGVLLFRDKRSPRTWAVNGKSQLCVTQESGTDCFTLQRHRKNRNEIVGQHVGQGWLFYATVEDGTPDF